MSMKKPDKTFLPSSRSVPSSMPDTIIDPSIKANNFNQILINRGIRFLHRRAAPCPNLRALDDNKHDPNCPICGAKGFLYYSEREIKGVFTGNSLEKLFEQQGVLEIGTTVITFPTEYEDGTQADFSEFDRLVIPDFEVRLWELKEYEPTTNNRQKLRYPITSIDHMSSVDKGVLKEYKAGIDFNIIDGEIEWVHGKEPYYNNSNERGDVYTVAYFANPVYTVLQTLRELRVSQELEGNMKVARRLPQEIIVRRDFLIRAKPDAEE